MRFQATRSLGAAALLVASLVGEAQAQCGTCFYPAQTIGFAQGYSIRPTLFGNGWRIKPRLIPFVMQQQPQYVQPQMIRGAAVPMQLNAVPYTQWRYEWGWPGAQQSPTPAQPQSTVPPGTSREQSIVVPTATLRGR